MPPGDLGHLREKDERKKFMGDRGGDVQGQK